MTTPDLSTLPGFDLHLLLCEQCRARACGAPAGRSVCACDRRHGHSRIGATLGRRFGERAAARAGLFRGLRVALEGASPPSPLAPCGARERAGGDADLPPDEQQALERALDRLSRCRAATLAGRAHPLSDETMRRGFEKGWVPSAAEGYRAIYPPAVALGRLLATLAGESDVGVVKPRQGALELFSTLHERHLDLDGLVLEAIRARVQDPSGAGAFTARGGCRVVDSAKEAC